MARKVRMFSRIDDAEHIVKRLCETQGDVLWCVNPNNVIVLGIENLERSKKNHTLAKIKAINGIEKTIMRLNDIGTEYAIIVYWSDWNNWSNSQRQWIIFHELLHVSENPERCVRHDCEDFRIILDYAGVDWTKKLVLPDLFSEDTKLKLELMPSLPGEDGDDSDDDDEE